jgi:uncharacterized membrane protein YbjE (DUF340 family)
VAIDPLLYAALAAGYLLGRAWRASPPWIAPAMPITVTVLIAFLGGELGATPLPQLLNVVPLALILVLLVAGFTLLFARWIPSHRSERAVTAAPRPWYGIGFLVALVGGLLLGPRFELPYSELITAALYVLLFLVGFGLQVHRPALRALAGLIAAAGTGALAAAVAFAALGGSDLKTALAASFGFGWYSLAGPLVATSLGAAAGLLAFLANFWYGGSEVRVDSSGSLEPLSRDGCA